MGALGPHFKVPFFSAPVVDGPARESELGVIMDA